MKQNIQDHERVLSASAVDADLPSFINKKIEQMDRTIAKAKSSTVECHNVVRKLRQILDMTDDEAHFHMKQSAFLYNLGAQTLPKTHHCFSRRLKSEYFKSPSLDSDVSLARKFNTLNRRHYVILSKNVLAASVVINSTFISSKELGNNVFHILTDAQNFYGMKYWFARNSYKKTAIHVVNYEEISSCNGKIAVRPNLRTALWIACIFCFPHRNAIFLTRLRGARRISSSEF